MAKKSVTINGRVEMVEYSPARQGGTLLMPTLTIRSKRDKLRSRKSKYRPDWKV